MKSVPLALVLLLLPAASAFAGDVDRLSVYSWANIETFFNKETLGELKVSASQEKSLKNTAEKRNKIVRRYVDDTNKVQKSKLPEKEKNTRLKALDTQLCEDLFASYGEILRPEQVKRMRQIVLQMRGMGIFEYPEIRSALKIGDKEVRALNEAYGKWALERRRDLEEDVKAKKITPHEAARRAGNYGLSVPKGIRTFLNDEQKKVLEDLLGKKFDYK